MPNSFERGHAPGTMVGAGHERGVQLDHTRGIRHPAQPNGFVGEIRFDYPYPVLDGVQDAPPAGQHFKRGFVGRLAKGPG